MDMHEFAKLESEHGNVASGHCCDNCKDGKKCVSEMTQEGLEKSTHEEFGPEHTRHIVLSEKEKARIKREAADATDYEALVDEWQTKYFSKS